MDGSRGLQIVMLCGIVWRSTLGFHSKSFRFEGGGRSKIIGLNRSGKSCRLRWVNYLHPGLKRGKMTPHEERLVLELHAKWGNRWSRIARKIPGRTDNEIKNYWRTHIRKMAQEKKRALSPSSSLLSTSSSNCSSSSNITTIEEGASFYDTGGAQTVASSAENSNKNNTNVKDQEKDETCAKSDQREYLLDDIWKEINLPEMNSMKQVYSGSYVEETCKFSCPSPTPLSWESLFRMDDEDENQFLSCFDYGKMG